MEMPKNCPHCKVKIEPEPGYFWGAMYFSYALVVGLSVSMIVIFFYFNWDENFFLMASVMLLVIGALSPLIFRISRMLMIYTTAPYRKYIKELGKKKCPQTRAHCII